MKRYWIVIIVIALLILVPLSAYACSTPVFRYAMERWMADYYEGVLIHKGPIAEDDPAVMLLQSEKAEFLNLRISKIDLESSEEEESGPAERIKSQLGIEVPETLPALVLWYPWHRGRSAPFWTGEFTPSTIEALIQSPTRQELAKRLTDGKTAVWIFVESGNADKDKAALQLLNQELGTATKQLNEMSAEFPEEEGLPGVSYEFSTLRVSRSDPKERMLLAMLLNSEPDLHKYTDEPIVFPVFGRGRALFALVGEGINADNLQEAIAFLTGPCGCEIKMLNPGVDLIMAVNWDAAVMQFYEEFYVTEEPIPELTSVFPEEPTTVKGTNDLNTSVAPSFQNKTGVDKTVETISLKQRGLGVIRTTIVSLGSILLLVTLGTLVVSRKRKERP